MSMKNYKRSEYKLDSNLDTLRQMARLANEYKNDTQVLLHMSITQTFDLLQSLYKREDGEVLQRPEITLTHGGDCDDQAIVVAAYALLNGISPKNIYFIEAAEKPEAEPVHVYTAVKYMGSVVAIDPLPHNKIFVGSGYPVGVHNLAGLLNA